MEKTYDEDEADRKNAKPDPKSHGGTNVTGAAQTERERLMRDAIPTKVSDADILANTPPVPQADKLAAIKRDEDAHGGMTARDRQDHPEREAAVSHKR